jgi:hypothetical protein
MKIRNTLIGSTAGIFVALAITLSAAVPANAVEQVTASPFIVPAVIAGDWVASQS